MQRVQRHDFTKGPLLLFFKWRAALGANAIAVPFCFMPDHTGENRRKAIEWLDLITQTSRVLVDVLEFNPKDREMVDRWRDFLDWMFKAGDDLKRWIHPAVNPFLYLWILRDLLRLGISDATMALVGHDTAAFDGNADLLGILEMPGARPTATAQYAALAPTVESAEVIAATPPADSDLQSDQRRQTRRRRLPRGRPRSSGSWIRPVPRTNNRRHRRRPPTAPPPPGVEAR